MQFRYYTGAEYNFLKMFSARAGFNFKEITAGIGIKYGGFALDYAYAWNYKSLLAAHQYLRISVIANIDEIIFIKKIVPASKIPTTGHLVMGQRNKKIAEHRSLDAKINYDIIDYRTSNILNLHSPVLGLTVDEFYQFLNDKNIKQIKFIIPVSESGFAFIYDEDLKRLINLKKDILISFYLPGTYINFKGKVPIEIKKTSKFIQDALIHFKNELNLPLNKYEIIFPEVSFINNTTHLYFSVVDNVLDFIKKRKENLGNIKLIIPGYLMLIDNHKAFKRSILEKIKNKFFPVIKDYSFEFEYENTKDKNKIIEIANLNQYIQQSANKIKDIFKDKKEINFYGNLTYDLKVNKVKQQFFYALWLANGIKSLLFNKFTHIYVPLKPEKIIYKDIIAKEKMLLKLDKMYPDLKETDPEKYKEMIRNIEKKLNVKRKIEDFDIISEKEKKPGYYIFEIFNKYIFEELILDKDECIVTKNKNNDETAIIYINNSDVSKQVDLKLENLAKGVYKIEKIIYNQQALR